MTMLTFCINLRVCITNKKKSKKFTERRVPLVETQLMLLPSVIGIRRSLQDVYEVKVYKVGHIKSVCVCLKSKRAEQIFMKFRMSVCFITLENSSLSEHLLLTWFLNRHSVRAFWLTHVCYMSCPSTPFYLIIATATRKEKNFDFHCYVIF
jgi:hypothetical protein